MMWRAAALLLAFQAAALVLAYPETLNEGSIPVAEGDDECLAAGESSCALSALQRRGAKLSAEAQEADADEEAEEEDEEENEELELLDAEDPDSDDVEAKASSDAASGGGKAPDMSRKDQAQMLRRLKKHVRKIAKLQKKMNEVEGNINDTYVMVVKELSGKNETVTPPPMESSKRGAKGSKHDASKGGRRRRRHHSAALPRRMKAVDTKIRQADAHLKSIWKQIKRSSDILVWMRKRITGGEIALAQEAEDEEPEPEESAEDAEDTAEGSDAEISVRMNREDLDVRIKQMNTETYDVNKDIEDLKKREADTQKLFRDTFRVS